jgi:hypothetical protein
MKRAILVTFLLTSALPGYASIGASETGDGTLLISFGGNIEETDADRFQELASTRNNASVILGDVTGGKMATAIRIGEIVKAKGYRTFAMRRSEWPSILIWLAGSSRSMLTCSRIGLRAGQADDTDKAVLRSYLARLGLDAFVIAYLSEASSNEKWLTAEGRPGFEVLPPGIGVFVFSPPAPAPPLVAPPLSRRDSSQP